jgi:antitoxin (DNA-binding transcriptional repressor) of toxin-antitoxin stability system
VDVSIDELGPRAEELRAAVERGEKVVVTVDGQPFANVQPRRPVGTPTPVIMKMLEEIGARARAAGSPPVDPADYDTGLYVEPDDYA